MNFRKNSKQPSTPPSFLESYIAIFLLQIWLHICEKVWWPEIIGIQKCLLQFFWQKKRFSMHDHCEWGNGEKKGETRAIRSRQKFSKWGNGWKGRKRECTFSKRPTQWKRWEKTFHKVVQHFISFTPIYQPNISQSILTLFSVYNVINWGDKNKKGYDDHQMKFSILAAEI